MSAERTAEFGELLRAAMQEQGLSQGKVAALVGVYEHGRYLDATQVRLLMTGQRKPIRELVERLIDVLDLPAEEAWHAAGLWPPDLDVAGYRRFRQYASAHAKELTSRKLILPAQTAVQEPPAAPSLPSALPSDPELERLIRQNRRPLSLVSLVAALDPAA